LLQMDGVDDETKKQVLDMCHEAVMEIQSLLAEMKKQVLAAVKNIKYINRDNRDAVKSAIRRTVRRMIYTNSQSSPMIVPIVVEK
ncbi:MAG: hypothetical protein IK037_00040, partial [Clostridia bacterium]|nr:hypothetical protein [Clostridia bacterium]